MTNEHIRSVILTLIDKYPITKVVLFGSRASHQNRDDSDVDLIIEFSESVTLLTLSMIKVELEEKLSLKVDVIHGPLTSEDMIEIKDEVVLYAA